MKKINSKSKKLEWKRIALLLTVFILLVAHCSMPIVVYANATIPSATPQFYVNDFAGIFSSGEKIKLLDNAIQLAKEYEGVQVVVSTISSLGEEAIEDYAVNMYNQYGIGKDDMGLLILLSTDDREIYVATGLGMEAYISDSKAGRYIDKYAIPYFKQNKFNDGLIALQDAFIVEISACLKEDFSTTETTTETIPAVQKTTKQNSDFTSTTLIFTFSVFAILFFVIVIALFRKEKNNHQSEMDAISKKLEYEKIHSKEISQSYESRLNQLSSSHSLSENQLRDKLISFEKKYADLQKEFECLSDKFNRAKTLHPDVEEQISEMIAEESRQKDIKTARKVDEMLSSFVTKTADKSLVHDLNNALSMYSSLTPGQKFYVHTDVSALNLLYNKSVELQKKYEQDEESAQRKRRAEQACKSINSISGTFNNKSREEECNRKEQEERQRRKQEEERQRRQQEELQRRKQEEERQRRQQEEERRRRQRMQSSSFGHSTHSSFGTSNHNGFGGRTGGGGAKRKF